MRTKRSFRVPAVVVTVLALGGAVTAAPALLGAPIPPTASSSRATVILVDGFGAIPTSARSHAPRALIIRRPNGTPRNLVLVTRQTQPADLDKAVSQLMQSLEHRPVVNAELRAFVAPARSNPTASRDRVRATNDLRRLITAKKIRLQEFGERNAIQIKLKAPKAK